MPTWTTPATITDGTVVDASDWNTQCVGNVEWLGAVLHDTAPGSRRLNHNGELGVWQRGTSFTTNGYTADGWQLGFSGGSCTVSRQTWTPGELVGQTGWFLRSVVASQSTSAHYATLVAKIEDVQLCAARTVSVSFWAKAGATANIGVEVQQSFGTGGAPSPVATGVGQSVEVGTSWARYTVEALAVPSISGKTLGTNNDHSTWVTLWLSGGSDWDTRSGAVGLQNETIDLWGLQIELGNVATAFENWRPADNLARCQRYYQSGRVGYEGYVVSGVPGGGDIVFRQEMRAAPTVTLTHLGAQRFPTTPVLGVVSTVRAWTYRTANDTGHGIWDTSWVADAGL